MDKTSNNEIGRGGDVQARQSDDGSFELVVSDASAASASPEPLKPAGQGASADDAAPETSAARNRGLKRVGLILLVIAIVGGMLVYATSGGDEEPTLASRAERSDGFQPYKEGPAGLAAPMIPNSSRAEGSDPARSDDERLPEAPPTLDKPRAYQPEPPRDELPEERGWEVEEAAELEDYESAEAVEEYEEFDNADEEYAPEEELAAEEELAVEEELEEPAEPRCAG
jgi:hypothetical protein